MTAGRRAALVIAAYAILALLLVPLYPHFVSPNELTRWVLDAAIVEEHTMEVSRFAALLGPRFEDLAEVDGRLYSNKAPGTAIFAIPAYLLARTIEAPWPAALRIEVNAMRLFAATFPLVLTGIVFVALGKRFNVARDRITTVVWILLFATPLFAYGLLLFSHALVAAALFASWALLFTGGPSTGRDIAAGAIIGIAVSAEYPAALPAALLVSALLFTRQWKRLATAIAAGLPFAAALGAYHYLAFGSITTLPYHYEKLPEYRTVARAAFFGIHLPDPLIMGRLLLDPGKGLFVFSPILLLAVPAFRAARARLTPPAWWTLLGVPVLIFLTYSGYPNWHGGWTMGPRYIVPMIPFITFPMLFRENGTGESVLCGWSVCTVVLTSLVFPHVPNDFPLPWGSLAMPLLTRGLIAPNLLHFVGRPAAVAVPLLIVIAAAALALPRMRGAAAALGLTIAILAGAQWTRFADSALIGLQRAYVADVYFEQSGELERFAEPDSVPPGLLRRRAFERTLPPASWPF